MIIKRKKVVYYLSLIIFLISFIPTFKFLGRDSIGICLVFIMFLIMTTLRSDVTYLNKILTKNVLFFVLSFIFICILLVEIILDRGVGQKIVFWYIIKINILFIVHQIMNEYYLEIYRKVINKLLKTMTFFYGISIIYIINNANVVKLITGKIADSRNIEYMKANIAGVGDSIYYMGIAILTIVIIIKKINKKPLIGGFWDSLNIVLATTTIIISTSLTAIGIYLIGICYIVIQQVSTLNLKKIIRMIVFIGITTVLFSKVMINVLNNPTFESMKLRIETLKIEDRTIKDQSRYERKLLNDISKETFKENIIFGCGSGFGELNKRIVNNRGIGGHSSIIDTLAMYGVFGVIIIIIMIIKLLYIKKNKNIRRVIFLLFVLSIILNPVMFNATFVGFIFLTGRVLEIYEVDSEKVGEEKNENWYSNVSLFK